MKEKFELFKLWILNQGVEISDKSNEYQCMDLAYAFIFFLRLPKATIQHLYAYEVYTQPSELTKKYFQIIKNTIEAIPQAGDLVVWSNKVGVAGHIAVCTGKASQASFESLDQNWKSTSRVAVFSHTYDNVLGWLRPIPQPDDACLIAADDMGKAMFSKLVHNSDLADQTVRKLELGPNADAVGFDTIEKSLAARDGKLTTCTTTLSTREAELAKQVAEVANRGEQVGRLKVQLTEKDIAHLAEITALKQTIPNVDDATKPLKAQIERLQSDFTAEAKLKGAALANLAECQKQLEIAQKGTIGTISFTQWIKLLGSVKW